MTDQPKLTAEKRAIEAAKDLVGELTTDMFYRLGEHIISANEAERHGRRIAHTIRQHEDAVRERHEQTFRSIYPCKRGMGSGHSTQINRDCICTSCLFVQALRKGKP